MLMVAVWTDTAANSRKVNQMTALKTLDTDFAAAMMARGARLENWDVTTASASQFNRKIYWRLSGIDQQWIDDYRQGKDGITRFMQNRKMLINVCKTELNQNHGGQ